MAKTSCDGCGRTITVAGGIGNFWSFGSSAERNTTAMTLEFEDGTSHLLCFPCIEALPDDPTVSAVEQLERQEE